MALSWKETQLNFRVVGASYKPGYKVRTLKNVVENPDETQVQALGETLASLGNGDALEDSEILTRHSIIPDPAPVTPETPVTPAAPENPAN